VSTTRSQLYRFARDLGNVEAVEHGYKRGGLSGAASGGAQREARRVIYRKAIDRSTTSCVPSDSAASALRWSASCRVGLGGNHGLEFVSGRPEVLRRPHHVLRVTLTDDLDIGGNSCSGTGSDALVMEDDAGDDVVDEIGAVFEPVAVEQQSKASFDVGQFFPPKSSGACWMPERYPLPCDKSEFALD